MSCRVLVALSFLLASIPAAAAGPASDAVRYFYDNVGAELMEENRDRFTGAAKAVLDANDRMWARDEELCIDFGITVDAQDFDEDEIARTLALDERLDGDTAALVTARFGLFGEPRTIEWSLVREGGAWKVADIAGPNNGWRLSELGCG